jgi:hypothetical protein
VGKDGQTSLSVLVAVSGLRQYRAALLVALLFTGAATAVPFFIHGHLPKPPPPPQYTRAAAQVGTYVYTAQGRYPLAWGCPEKVSLVASDIPTQRHDSRAYTDPAKVAERGLDCHAEWTGRHDPVDLARAVVMADWLVKHQDQRTGAWYYAETERFGPTLSMHAPWLSARPQGLGMSLLTRIFGATKRPKYLRAARLALRPLTRSIADGGLRTPFFGRGTWYDGYSHDPPVYSLNDFLVALLGLHDLSLAATHTKAPALFRAGMRTLPRALRYFDTGTTQLYWLYHITQRKPHWSASAVPCGSRYRASNTWLLAALQSVTPDPWLKFYRDLWANYLDAPTCQHSSSSFAPRPLNVSAAPSPTLISLRNYRYDVRGRWPLTYGCPEKWPLQDPHGVPLAEYGGRTYYNAGTIAVDGLGCYAVWTEEGDRRARAVALRLADWLIIHQDRRTGVWYDPVKYVGLFTIQPPWASTFIQGPATSLLARAYLATKAPRYIRAARLGLKPLGRSVALGGVGTAFFGVGTWYEGYPHVPPTYALDDFLYALLGAYDVSHIVSDPFAKRLFRSGVRTLASAIPYFDVGDTSLYWLYHITQRRPQVGATQNACTSYERKIYAVVLGAVYSTAPNPWLQFYRDLWARQYDHPVCQSG